MPDVLGSVFAEHSIALAIAGAVLVGVLLGPWAIIRVAMRRWKPKG